MPKVEPQTVTLKISEYEDSSGINEDMDESDKERSGFDLVSDESFLAQTEDSSRHLDRRRNRVVRKLSLKKSKSNKPLTETLSPTKGQHKPVSLAFDSFEICI